jgi:hypothetical protein
MFNFKGADVELSRQSYNADIVLRCCRSMDDEGNNLDSRTQVPLLISMDNYQAYQFAMEILKRIDVQDTRGNN